MKLVTYLEFGKEQIGLVINNRVYNLKLAASVKSALKIPDSMKDFLKAGPHVMSVAKEIDNLIKLSRNFFSGHPKDSTVEENIFPARHFGVETCTYFQ